MLSYNSDKLTLEFDRQVYENYINERLQKDKLWNETQLTLLVQTLIDSIETILEVYKFYPGSAIKLLETLRHINAAKEDKNNYFLNKIIDLQNNENILRD